MRERKYVKFRVDMYDDTKFKIIDRKPERDLIHYVWNRVVVLAGKVDLDGSLYLSKNTPYTVETLAIELNRDIEQVKLALEVLIELEMVEVTKDNVYRVKNFAKHQNIKAKVDNKTLSKNNNIQSNASEKHEKLNEEFSNNINQIQIENSNNNEISHAESNVKSNNIIADLKASNKEISEDNAANNNCGDNIPIVIEMNANSNKNKKKKKDIAFEFKEDDVDDSPLMTIKDGEYVQGEDETIIAQWTF